MRILYSPVGDTDPIRGMHDGGMLHIIRHYQPDVAILFLTKEMKEKEEDNQRYSKAIRSIAPQINLQLVKTDLVDVHKIDALMSLVEDFHRVRDEYSDHELMVNLSSGTPQMKEIMSYLCIEYDIKGIQVDSPQRSSNRSEAALQDYEDIDIAIDTNLDNESDAISRCSEPKLEYLKSSRIKQQLINALQNYKYDEADRLFNSYKSTLPYILEEAVDISAVLKHANLRVQFDYDKALTVCKRFERLSLTSIYGSKEVRELAEFLMIMEVRLKQKQIEDFILKTTPFMYKLMRFYLTKVFGVLWKEVEINTRTGIRVDMIKMKEKYPQLYISWEANQERYNQNYKIQLSLYHMLDMIRDQSNIDKEVLSQIEQVRLVEQKIRNKLAHEMIIFTESDIAKKVDIPSLAHFYQQLRNLFYRLIDVKVDKSYNKLIYDEINLSIIERLK